MERATAGVTVRGAPGAFTGPWAVDAPVRSDVSRALPGRADRRAALILVALEVLVVLAVLPFGNVRTTYTPPGVAIFPVVLAANCFCGLGATYFLWREFALNERLSLAALGLAYLVGALVPIPMNWVDPSVITLGTVFGGLNGGRILWVLYHFVFIALVLASVPMAFREAALWRSPHPRRWILALALGTPLAILALSAALMEWRDSLPRIVSADPARDASLLAALDVPLLVFCALTLAVVALRTRLRTMLGLWVCVSLLGIFAEIALMVAFPVRPSVGFWFSHLEELFASAAPLVMFLQENGRLNALVTEQRHWLSSVVDNVADALLTLDAAGRITWCNRAAEQLLGAPSNAIIETPIGRWLEGEASAPESTVRRSDGTEIPVETARTSIAHGAETTIVLIVRDVTARRRSQDAMARARDQALRAARSKADFLAMMSHELRTPINAIIGMTELLGETPMSEQQHEYAATVHGSAEALRIIIDDVLDVSKLEAGKLALDSLPFDPLDAVEEAAGIVAVGAQKKGLELVTFVDPAVPRVLWGDPHRLRQVLLNLLSNAVKFTDRGTVYVSASPVRIQRDSVTLRFEVEDSGIGISSEAQTRLFTPFEQVDQSGRRRHGGTGLGLSISRGLVALMGGTIGVRSAPGEGSLFWFEARFARLEEEVEAARPELSGMRVLIALGAGRAALAVEQIVTAWGGVATIVAEAGEARARLAAAAQAGAPFDVALIDERLPRRGALLDHLGRTRLVLATEYESAAEEEGVIARYLRKPIRQSVLLEALTKPARLPVEAPKPALAAPLSTARLLLVEDHPINRAVAVRQLERLGYSVAIAMNGREAVEATERDEYALVLMDCQMPEMDGFDATRAIRRREGVTGAHVPIVAMTANAMEGDRESCLAAGMDDYLAKPVRLDDLRSVLTRFGCSGA